jgi:curved DNA-binding protein CbpA
MTDLWEVLGLVPGTSECEIRQRYLELVRQFPPDREPRRFTEIRAAYDALRDPVVRLQSQLFEFRSTDSLDAMILDVQQRLRKAKIPLPILLSLAETA